MLQFPNFDPVALRLGPLAIHWYGLMYLTAFASAWLLGRWRISHGKTRLTLKDLEDIIFYGVLGVIAGGRLGYVIFYKPIYYLSHPIEIFYLWEGGMSFHGGLLGVLVMVTWIARSRKYKWLEVSDFVAPLIPLGLAAGRLGNFINGELWGRPSTLAWAMVFPQSGDGIARHPSQLYQLGLEGLLLFALVWWFANKPRPTGQVSAIFLMGYGFFRFIAEYAREPDDFLGLLTASLSMGQWLSLPMIAAGAVLFKLSSRKTNE
ncbi:MAG: prolipoprotein diacylglyceryl transferase [Sheuella sp.]|nr:prolipoprotein diacylglyceryl transferase [Sheuella sp.]